MVLLVLQATITGRGLGRRLAINYMYVGVCRSGLFYKGHVSKKRTVVKRGRKGGREAVVQHEDTIKRLKTEFTNGIRSLDAFVNSLSHCVVSFDSSR